MSEIERRVGRAFRDHGSFERRDESTFESTTTPFEGVVEVDEAEGGAVSFDLTVRVPTLNRVTEDHVADVVEAGWAETFELRVVDVGGVTARDRDLDPDVTRERDALVVEVSFTDLDERRGVDDAAALINFVEGTYVQGIIPGYEYTEPVSELISQAAQAGGGPAEQ
ncbi:MAG: DUF5813 family protein [Haloferacaceae archaeon]